MSPPAMRIDHTLNEPRKIGSRKGTFEARSIATATPANIATPPRVALAVQVGAGDEALGAKSAAGNDSAEGSEGAQPADAGAQRAELERAVVRVQRATVLCVLAATVPLAVLAALL